MKKILLGVSFFLTTLFANDSEIDAFIRYNYEYLNGATMFQANTIIKYDFSGSKNRYGYKDILLYSLRSIAKEVKQAGENDFAMIYFSDEKVQKKYTLKEFIKHYSNKKNKMARIFKEKEDSGSSFLGSALKIAGGVAMLAIAKNSIANSGHTMNSTTFIEHGTGATLSPLDNKEENNIKSQGKYFDQSNFLIYYGKELNNKEFRQNKNIALFSVKEIENYFKKENPFRIKELYTANNKLIVRGMYNAKK